MTEVVCCIIFHVTAARIKFLILLSRAFPVPTFLCWNRKSFGCRSGWYFLEMSRFSNNLETQKIPMFSVDVESGQAWAEFRQKHRTEPGRDSASPDRRNSRRSKSYKVVLSLHSVVSLDLTAESSMIRTEWIRNALDQNYFCDKYLNKRWLW